MKDRKYGPGLYGLGLDLNHHGAGYPHPALIIVGFVNKICLRVLGQL